MDIIPSFDKEIVQWLVTFYIVVFAGAVLFAALGLAFFTLIGKVDEKMRGLPWMK